MQGYQPEAETSVQFADLRGWQAEFPGDVHLQGTESDAWEAAFHSMAGLNESQQAIHRQILRAILPAKGYAAVCVNGQVIGCGLAVCQGGWVGIFDVVIHPDFRGQGYGKRLMMGLLAWGFQQGARHSYLQVMKNNDPALCLYARLGFEEAYVYWYRVKRTDRQAQPSFQSG